MSPDTLQKFLDSIERGKNANQTELKRLEEHFQHLITESKELKLELTPELVYTEISNTYKYIFTLWDTVYEWQKIIAIQSELNELSARIPNIPKSEKQNPETEALLKRIENLEQFQKHIIETVANKPMPKETKPHEGMYE